MISKVLGGMAGSQVGDNPNEEVHGTACLQPDASWLIL